MLSRKVNKDSEPKLQGSLKGSHQHYSRLAFLKLAGLTTAVGGLSLVGSRDLFGHSQPKTSASVTSSPTHCLSGDFVGSVSWQKKVVVVADGYEQLVALVLGAEIVSSFVWQARSPSNELITLTPLFFPEPLTYPVDIAPPIEGDKKVYVNAKCTKVIPPQKWDCKESKSGGVYTSGDLKGFMQCERADTEDTCTETFTKIGTMTRYSDKECKTELDSGDILVWAC